MNGSPNCDALVATPLKGRRLDLCSVAKNSEMQRDREFQH